MASLERVSTSLPNDLLEDIDRREENRSKFVALAVRRELDRRRLQELRRSLQNPHPEIAGDVEQDLDEWSSGLPAEDTEALVDDKAGRRIRWVQGEGWVEDRE